MSAEQPRQSREPLTAAWWIRHLYRSWHDDRVSGLAAEIGFFALLSLFPLLLVGSAALGWLGDVIGADLANDVEDQLTEWAGSLFGRGAGVTEAVRNLFDGSSTSVLTVGIAATIYTASRGFSAVVRALDVAYGHYNTRGWVGTQFVGLLLAIGTILVGSLTLAVLVIGPLLGREDFIGNGALGSSLSFLWRWLRYPVAVTVLVGWSATIYYVAPNRRASWRNEIPGAAFSALFSLLASGLFSIYLRTLDSSSNAVFGAIGTAITLQLWLYLLAIGLILGAEINAGFAVYRPEADAWTEPLLFTRAFRRIRARIGRRVG